MNFALERRERGLPTIQCMFDADAVDFSQPIALFPLPTVSLLPHKDHHLYTGTGAHLVGQQVRTWLKAQAND